jgi:hypothetical protein
METMYSSRCNRPISMRYQTSCVHTNVCSAAMTSARWRQNRTRTKNALPCMVASTAAFHIVTNQDELSIAVLIRVNQSTKPLRRSRSSMSIRHRHTCNITCMRSACLSTECPPYQLFSPKCTHVCAQLKPTFLMVQTRQIRREP